MRPVSRQKIPGPGGLLGVFAMLILSVPVITTSQAQPDNDTGDLADLSLEELLGMEITTLSRKSETLGSAPAAVYVISQSDIRRSGARTIPDLLRMVPGMQVAQIDGSTWAVTARGANGRFANKLLVLMDGRTLYNPLLSGVYWDIQDTDFDAIERIEVIRGPGATMWGANAVNGIVNIITKDAARTQGGAVELLASDRNSLEGVMRYGGTAGAGAYRLFAKVTDRDGNAPLNGMTSNDFSKMARVGGRADINSQDRELTFSGEAYSGESGETRNSFSLAPPYQTVGHDVVDVSGAFGLLRWSKDLTPGSNLQMRSYYASNERNSISLAEVRKTFDLDLQHRFELGQDHDIMWGLGYRHSRDHTVGSFQLYLDPANRSQRVFSGFVQDDIALFDERARLIVGSKFENSNFSRRDVEFAPSVRLSVDVGDFTTLWGAVSRAVRVPSRGEQDGVLAGAVLPPGYPLLPLPVPLVAVAAGNPQFESEEVTAYEFGYRLQREDLVLDVALFYNSYDNLRGIETQLPTCQPSGIVLPLDPSCIVNAQYVESASQVVNGDGVENHGAELSVSRQLTDWWRIRADYTYFNFGNQSALEATDFAITEDSPRHQASVRSAMELPKEMTLDLWLRHVGELPSQQISSYTALDLRLNWAPTERLSVAAVGRNLIAGKHIEFESELGDLLPVQIEPEGYLEVTWSF